MKDEPLTAKDFLSDDFEPGPGLKDGHYAISEADVLTNHSDFTCPDLPQAIGLIAEIQGKHITELQLPREAELQNWTEDPCEPYALALTLDNGAHVWLPLIDMDGEDGLFHVHTDMVGTTSKRSGGSSDEHKGTGHNEAATSAAVSRTARRREEKAARKATKRRKNT